MSKIFLKAIGCKVSQHDALAGQEFLEEQGHVFVHEINDADCAIIQTCTVTQKSDSEARQCIRHLKKVNPALKIIVTGCYAQRAPEELSSLEVDSIIGNLNPQKWQVLLREAGVKNAAFAQSQQFPDDFFAQSTRTFDKTRPYLKIYDGCDHTCSYCIVPSVRGKGKSLLLESVLSQLNKLLQHGFKEIIITGVNLASYGKDIGMQDGLYQLSRAIESIDADFRVRFSSIEPTAAMQKFFEFVCMSKHCVPHFHLPIQHISAKILHDMRRPYCFEEFEEIITAIQHIRKDACIGSDIIVGFPTETATEFQECHDFLAKSTISYLHVFHFSPRPGTDAHQLKQQSTDRAVKERSALLRSLSHDKFTQFKQSLVGSTRQILTFRYDSNATLTGITDNYIHVIVQHRNKQIPEHALIKAKLLAIDKDITLVEPVEHA
jgi:threonylcarbamoyladenosine tRNA methylthiotransferase MtaB